MNFLSFLFLLIFCESLFYFVLVVGVERKALTFFLQLFNQTQFFFLLAFHAKPECLSKVSFRGFFKTCFSFLCLEEKIFKKSSNSCVWNLNLKAFARIKQFQEDLMRKIDYFFPRFFNVLPKFAFPLFVRVVLNFTQFHLIDIFIVMLKSFALRALVWIYIYFSFFFLLSHKRLFRSEWNVGIHLFQSSSQHIRSLLHKVWIFSPLSSRHLTLALNWVYFGSKNNFSCLFLTLFLRFIPTAFCYTIWNVLFMDLCGKRELLLMMIHTQSAMERK